MGKTKTNRIKKRSSNPIGIPSVKELQECEELIYSNFETGTVESTIEKVIFHHFITTLNILPYLSK